jgi:hypothetical protein
MGVIAKSKEQGRITPPEYAMRPQASARFRAVELATSHAWRAVPAGGVNLSLRIVWRWTANFAKQGKFQCSGRPCDVA